MRMPNMFFTSKPEKKTNNYHPLPQNMTDSEIYNKICEITPSQRGKYRECEISDLCKYGQEAMRRGLV